MSAARKPAIWPNALATAVAIAAGLTLSTYAQSGRTGGLVQYVGVELGSPFTAQWVTTSAVTGTDGRERTSQMVETAARDSSGRIRFEKLRAAIAGARDRPVTLYTHEGGTITTSENELHRLVSVYDTPESRIVTLQPGLHIAEVRAWDGKLPEVPGTRAYSSYFIPFDGHIVPLNVKVEDLGLDQIEGLSAHGYRITVSETVHADGERTAARIHEFWVSDDLSATLLEIRDLPEKKVKMRSSLIHIKREEPDASLFKIPADYKINPRPEEIPCPGQPRP